MPRGERVGEAYVRIHADGEGMDREIRQMFADEDGEFDDAGRHGYTTFRKGFEDEATKPKNESALRHSLTKALARGDYLSNDFFKGEAWRGFRDDLETRMGDTGRRAADNLERELQNGLDFAGLRARLNNMNSLLSQALRENFNDLTKEFSTFQRDVDRLNSGLDTGGKSRSDLIRDMESIKERMHAGGFATHEFTEAMGDSERTLRNAHPTLSKFEAGIDSLANKIGRGFGKGSRNDFLNFTGSFVGGLFRMVNIIPKVVEGFTKVGDIFRSAFSQASANGATGLQAALAGVEGVALAAAGGLLAVAVSAGVIILAVGPAVAALSLLAAILTALVSTLAFGLLGAIGAVAGALLPLVAGAGVAFLAFKNMDGALKALGTTSKKVFGPIKTELDNLGKGAAAGAFMNIEQQARRLVPIIAKLNPLFVGVGRAISHIGDYWLDALSGPGFTAFRREMTAFLPHAVESLGRSFGNALGGLGGIFRALIPITNQFLGWLQKITGEFARWANSAKGQEALKNFFDRAGDSAKALGDFAKEALDFVVQLIDKGNSSGNTIFEDMANGLRNAGDYLESHPDALKNWFDDAVAFSRAIGDAAQAITKLLDDLDNSATRTIITTIFQGVGLAIQALTQPFRFVIDGVNAIVAAVRLLGQIHLPSLGGGGDLGVGKIAAGFTALVPLIQRVMSSIGPAVASAIGAVPGIVIAILNRIPGLAHGVANLIGSAFSGVAGRIGSLLGGIPGAVSGILNRLPGFARSVANAAGSAFSGVLSAIRGHFNGVPGAVSGILNRLGGIASSAANAAGSAFSRVLGVIRGHFNGIPGAVQGILSRLGSIASSAASAAVNAFSRVQSGVIGHFNGIPGAVAGVLGRLAGEAASAASAVVGKFSGLAGRIISAVGAINFPKPHIPMPDIPHISLPTLNWPVHLSIPHIPGTAVGGTFFAPEMRLIGEAGPEAVVPLNRPLSQVDPSVRWLSAIAQGKSLSARMDSPGGPSKQYNIDMTVVTPNSDSRAVASEVLHRLTAAGY